LRIIGENKVMLQFGQSITQWIARRCARELLENALVGLCAAIARKPDQLDANGCTK